MKKVCDTSCQIKSPWITLINEYRVVSLETKRSKNLRHILIQLLENLGIHIKYKSEEPESYKAVPDIKKRFENHPRIIKVKES